jgi:flagellar biosynthesis protein FlhF
MRIRTFLAKDMKEALATMRAELGEDAVIVASERLKDGSLCLRAGIEQVAEEVASSGGAAPSTGGESAAYAATFEDRYHDDLLERLRSPKQQQEMKRVSFERATLLRLLLEHRTPEALAGVLADDGQNSGIQDMSLALAAALDKRMRTNVGNAVRDRAMVLTGPPGSGKTAVAGKLAAQFRLAGEGVVLVSTDLDSAGQVARLEGFASCLDLSIVRVAEPAALADLLGEAHRKQFLVIADSGGCDPREPLARETLRFLAIDGLAMTAVVSATMDAEEATEIARAFGKLGAVQLMVTGLDLARRKGALVALAASGLPIAYVTSSPYLATGLQTLTPLALAKMLVGGAHLVQAKAAA